MEDQENNVFNKISIISDNYYLSIVLSCTGSFIYLVNKFQTTMIEKEYNGFFNSPQTLRNRKTTRNLVVDTFVRSLLLGIFTFGSIKLFEYQFLPVNIRTKRLNELKMIEEKRLKELNEVSIIQHNGKQYQDMEKSLKLLEIEKKDEHFIKINDNSALSQRKRVSEYLSSKKI